MNRIELDALRKRALKAGVSAGSVRRAERLRAQAAREARPSKAQRFSTRALPALDPPQRVDEAGVRWVVAYVSPSRAIETARDLCDLGFRAYCPIGRRLQTQPRRQKGGAWKRRVIASPVFGGYIFVGEGEESLGRSAHDRIVEVLRDASGSLSVAPETIRTINDAELDGAYDRLRARPEPFRAGSHVKAAGGALAEFQTVVEAVEGRTRVRLGLKLFGGSARVYAAPSGLEPA